MKYRIVQKYTRGYINTEIKSYYIVQYRGIDFLNTILNFKKCYKWKDYKEDYYCGNGEFYKDIKTFNKLSSAREFVANMNTKIPRDSVISNN